MESKMKKLFRQVNVAGDWGLQTSISDGADT
jgi:hypothetical protein